MLARKASSSCFIQSLLIFSTSSSRICHNREQGCTIKCTRKAINELETQETPVAPLGPTTTVYIHNTSSSFQRSSHIFSTFMKTGKNYSSFRAKLFLTSISVVSSPISLSSDLSWTKIRRKWLCSKPDDFVVTPKILNRSGWTLQFNMLK